MNDIGEQNPTYDIRLYKQLIIDIYKDLCQAKWIGGEGRLGYINFSESKFSQQNFFFLLGADTVL